MILWLVSYMILCVCFCCVDKVHSSEHAVVTSMAASSSILYTSANIASSVVGASVSGPVPSTSVADHPQMSSGFASTQPTVS